VEDITRSRRRRQQPHCAARRAASTGVVIEGVRPAARAPACYGKLLDQFQLALPKIAAHPEKRSTPIVCSGSVTSRTRSSRGAGAVSRVYFAGGRTASGWLRRSRTSRPEPSLRCARRRAFRPVRSWQSSRCQRPTGWHRRYRQITAERRCWGRRPAIRPRRRAGGVTANLDTVGGAIDQGIVRLLVKTDAEHTNCRFKREHGVVGTRLAHSAGPRFG
jgi:hypothetical protein